MNIFVAIIGVQTIILLAVLIGVAAGRQARDAAWRSIAETRRNDTARCRNCPFRYLPPPDY